MNWESLTEQMRFQWTLNCVKYFERWSESAWWLKQMTDMEEDYPHNYRKPKQPVYIEIASEVLCKIEQVTAHWADSLVMDYAPCITTGSAIRIVQGSEHAVIFTHLKTSLE